jgi:hypothetical protein
MNPFDSNNLSESRKEDENIFLARLQLIVVMSKAYLEGFPIGKYRKQAIIENANSLFYLSLFAEHSEAGFDRPVVKDSTKTKQLYEKVRLLSVMAKAFAEGRLIGEQKRRELQENIDYVCETIMFNSKINNIDFLHVA